MSELNYGQKVLYFLRSFSPDFKVMRIILLIFGGGDVS